MKNSILLYISLALLTACQVAEPILETAPATSRKEVFNSGTLLVEFDDEMTALIESGEKLETKAPGLESLLEEWGAASLERVFPDAGVYEERTRREGLHRFYRIRFSERTPVTKAAEGIAGMPGVVSAHGELPVRRRAVFDDPYFASQWHLVNGRYQGADINVQKVWENFTTGTPNVIVSVVDDGAYVNHADLSTNIVPCYADGSGSFNFTNNTPRLVPSSSHGTHVCGTIAAVSNNGTGVAGVAGGGLRGETGVRVLSCQIFGGYGEPDIYQAMKHGADHGAVILQCSWGFSPDMDGDGFTTDEEIALYRSYTIDHPELKEYKAAIDYFIKYAGCDNKGVQLPDAPMKGGVVFFAAGNDNFDYDPLVSYDEVVAVGAFGATGYRASYSNYGDWVDIAAPGGDSNLGIYSTLLSDSYGGPDWIGTSFACPHASGVAALLVSYFGGPGFTAADCKKRLLRGAVSDFIAGNKYIGKKLDAYGAFTYDMNTQPMKPSLSWDVESLPAEIAYNQTVELPFTISDPNAQYVRVTMQPEIKYGVSLTRDKNHGKLIINGGESVPGSHAVDILGVNEDGLSDKLSINYSVLENRSPQFRETLPAGLLFTEGADAQTLDLSALATDPDGDPLNWTVREEGACISLQQDGAVLRVRPLSVGEGNIVLTVSDGGSEPASCTLPVVVAATGEICRLYPIPVVNDLYVEPLLMEKQTWTVTIWSAEGAQVMREALEGSAFAPGRLDLSRLAPGRYAITLSGPGTIGPRPLIKI